MRKTISAHKCLSAAVTVTGLVALCLLGYLYHPRAAKAASLESPGGVFAPIVVYRGQKVRLCANNFFGDGSVRWLLEFRSHDDANKVLASSGWVELGAQKGACLESDASDLLKVAAGDVNGDSQGIIAVLRTTLQSNFTGGVRSFPVSSLQVCPSDPAGILIGMNCFSMLPAVQGNGLLLPAVQR